MSDSYIRDPENDLTYDSNTGSYVLTSSLTSNYTLTIVPTPSDATVTLTAEGYTQLGNSITVPEGFTVIYSVVKPGYAQKRDSVVVDSDITLYITLDPAEVDIIDESTTVKELEVNSTVYDIVGKGILDQNTKTTQLEWFGTLAEYNALEEYSDYCTYYITDDLGISNEYDLGHLTEIINDFDVDTFKPEVDAIKNSAISDINEATSNSVEQIKNMGEVVNYTNISNCITEIPQDIKLELSSDGVLTLKAGSKVYIPFGSGVFNAVTTTADVSTTRTDSQECIVWRTASGGLNIFPKILFYSGATAPTQYQYMFWYDTTENKCKVTNNTGSTWAAGASFPICLVETDGTKISAIKQVFNGFGHVGATVFALPGVKGLIPNGRNADGSLKSNVLNITSVKTYTLSSTAVKEIRITNAGLYGYRGYIVSDNNPSVNFNLWYNPVENIMYDTGGSGTPSTLNATVGISVEYNGTRITSFTPKTVFQAVDYSDFKKVYSMIMPDYSAVVTLSANVAYTATVPGWIIWKADNVQQGALTISGTNMAGAGGIVNKWADFNSIFVPVDVGDTYQSSGHTYFAFYPCKGVK